MPAVEKSGIKSKIIFIFIIAVTAMIMAAGFALYSLEKMLGTIEYISSPNYKAEVLNDISNDLLRLNQYKTAIRSQEDPEALEDFARIVHSIDCRLDTLKQLLRTDPLQVGRIDSVQYLMNEILIGMDQLSEAYQINNRNSFSSRVLKEISDQLQVGNLQIKDSSYVVKSQTSEIKISNYTLQALDSLSRVAISDAEDNFWRKVRRFFAKREKRETEVLDTIVLLPEKKIDTLYTQVIDTVIVSTSEELMASLREVINQFYQDERKTQHHLRKLEKTVNEKNAILLDIIQSIFIELKNTDYLLNFSNIENAYGASEKFKNALTGIILFFMLAGFLLLYFLMADLKRIRYYQEKLIQEKNKSDKAVQIKQKFLATMSHEIRTPLTSIIGYSNLLDNHNEYIHAIKKSSEHLLKTANEILDLAKIESGIIEINREVVHPGDLLQDLYLTFKLRAEAKKLSFNFDIPEDTPLIYTDSYRFNQVFFNLLHNAIKFTDTGEIQFTADFMQHEQWIEAVFVLRDTGIGIDKPDQERIFEDFHQAGNHPKKKKGAGLGLGIVKKVVSLMGGSLELKSTPGEGSIFTLSFRFESAENAAYNKKEEFENTSDIFKGLQVLVVDDDPLILKLQEIVLSSCGAKVTLCERPEQALKCIEIQSFNFAILDIHLPGMNGYQLCEKIRQICNEKTPKMIAATADVLTKNSHPNYECFDEILYKPVDKTDLIRKIASLLNLSSAITVIENGIENNTHYDLTDYRKYAMGDEELLTELMLQFYIETREDVMSLENAAKGDQITICHKLTSRLAQIKLRSLSAQARDIEARLRSGFDIPDDELIIFSKGILEMLEKIRIECNLIISVES